MVEAICKEIVERQQFISDYVRTIYFGGGTPSVLTLGEVEQIMTTIYDQFDIIDNPEVTFECNPDDLTAEYLKGLWTLGVNRLSIGVQSFDDEILKWMNRSHSNEQTHSAIEHASKIGFKDITIDLIYGVPQLSASNWKSTINHALQLPVNHLSAYSLTLEPNTPYQRLVNQKKYKMPDEDLASEHYAILIEEIQARGWEHYEVSNFCKTENYSKHNMAYWQGIPYLGVGPGAHSFNGNSRFWNIANNKEYISRIDKGISTVEEEVLSAKDKYNEAILTGLRTKWGVDLNKVDKLYKINNLHNVAGYIKQWVEKGWMKRNADHIGLTEEGFLFADYISSELFVD